MKERAVLLGKTKSLVGVITEPERTVSVRSHLGVVLLNAGLVHRIGPNRISVQIARRLAASGFPALRFDLAGIGDSGNRTDDLSLKDGVVSDAKEVMDFLTREEGARQFIFIGICSGADNSLRIAASDARVIGAVPIEPYTFSTQRYHFYAYGKRLLDPRSWWRAVSMKSDFWRLLKNYRSRKDGLPKTNGRSGQASEGGGAAFRNQILSETRDLLSRGVHLHFVYCVDSPSYYNHYLPLRGKAASWERFRATLYEDTDHTFTLLSSQESLVNLIHEWVKGVEEKGGSLHRGLSVQHDFLR